MHGEGPLVGRAGVLDAVVECLVAGRGVTVEGQPGVGKTRLISEAAALLHSRGGHHLVAVAATVASQSVPLGALAGHLVGAPPGADDLARVEESLLRRAQGAPLIVVADDAHLLDDHSAVVLHQLALGGQARILASVRSGVPASSAVEALAKDGFSERLFLPPLGEADIADLVVTTLGGPVDAGLTREVWVASRGNPMVAALLLEAGIGAGTVVQEHGLWTANGALTADGRLLGLIGAQLDQLAPAEREALEVVAMTEPLDTVLVDRLVPPRVVQVLERRGFVRGSAGPGGPRLRLAHPMYGDAVRGTMTEDRRRAVVADLAAALDAAGPPEAEMLLRVAVWGAAAGCALHADLLVRAAAVARSRSPDSAAHLLQAALAAGAPAGVALELAEVLTFAGRPAEADGVLSGIVGGMLTADERVVVAATRAAGLTWVQQRPSDALAVLADVRTPDVVAPVPTAMLDVAEGAAHLVAGDPAAAGQAASRSLGVGDLPDEVVVQGATVAVVAAAYQGRTAAALATADRWCDAGRRVRERAPVLAAGLLGARWTALELAGDLATMAAEADPAWRQAVDDGDDHLRARAAQALARAALLGARPRRAVALVRQVLVALAPFDRMFAAWNLALLAEAAAVAGDVADARDALGRCDGLGAIAPVFAADRARAESAVLAAEGNLTRAAEVAADAARQAAGTGSLGMAARCWLDAVRFGRAIPAGAVEAFSSIDGALGPAARRFVTARAAQDGPALDGVAASFTGLGAYLFASEAGAEAARAHRRAGRSAAALASLERARSLLDGEDPVRTPALRDLDAEGPPLTAREREVALLAVSGSTDRSIAEALGISVRTVETHLGRVYAKLDVEDRKALAEVLGVPAT